MDYKYVQLHYHTCESLFSLCEIRGFTLDFGCLLLCFGRNLFIRKATKTVNSSVGMAANGYQRAGTVKVVIPKIDYRHNKIRP
jgi:hypothetical protein